jgi:type VI secretion system protein ImpG
MKNFMKKMREYYERELNIMQRFNAEFAAEFPAQAGRLGMDGGQRDDPHIERFIQATALSNARTAKLIDDNDQKMTEALLQVNYPHYLRPFPSTAILRIDMRRGVKSMTAPCLIAKGATLTARSSNASLCRFKTVYDVHLTPIAVAKVAFSSFCQVPPALPRPAEVNAMLSIDLECATPGMCFAQVEQDLRVFIDAEPSLCAHTRDALFMRAKVAYLEISGTWLVLKGVPLKPVGFAPNEALLPRSPLSHHAYLLLTEFFAYPEKFSFFDIDWAVLATHLQGDSRRVTLHLGLADLPADSHLAQSLSQLSSSNFVLGCTPVVNLFKRAGCPIDLTHTATDYALNVNGNLAEEYDIYSVDKVTTVEKSRRGHTFNEFRPYYSLRHGEQGSSSGRYYVVRRDALMAVTNPGHETRIALVNLEFDPLNAADASVSIDLTCTNRDMPVRLGCGDAASAISLDQATDALALRLLRRPTPQYRFNAEDHWRLIAHLSLSHCALSPDGLSLLKETLTMYDLPRSPVTQRQIAGIVGLAHQQTTAWMRDDGRSSLVQGLAVRVIVDEDAFAGTGLHLFASVLDHFFGLYVHCHCFTQLTVLSQSSGKELIRCNARSGALSLV